MRLVCVECSAAYEAPDNLFGPQPREVRCNRCGYQWTVLAPQHEEAAAVSSRSIGPGDAPATAPASLPEAPRPRPAMAPELRAAIAAGPATPSPASPLKAPDRVAADLAAPVIPREAPPSEEMPRPMLAVEPAAESTRTLLSSSGRGPADIAPPDPEERRLSHELDFGETDRPRRTPEIKRGTRRTVLILIVLLILAGVAAVVFEAQILAAIPRLKSVYAQLGL